MLPLQAHSAVQTDILPTQNLGLQDQIQPQIYSLLTDTNNSPLRTKHRRKKPTKLDEVIPVIINPQITRGSAGMTLTTPHHHHHSTRLPQSLPSFLPAQTIDDSQLLLRLYLDSSCDANKSVLSHKQMPPSSIPLNYLSALQSQQNSIQTNESTLITNTNSIPRIMRQSEFWKLNPLLTNHINEKTTSISSTEQNIYKHIYPQLLYIDRNSMPVDDHYTIPISAPTDVPRKPKGRYSKRMYSVTSEEKLPPTPPLQQQQQQLSPSSTVPIQSTYSNGLPSIIPATLTVPAFESDDHCLSRDLATRPNLMSLPSPSSLSSTKSSSVNGNNELSLVPIQQTASPRTCTNMIETNPKIHQNFGSQECSLTQKSNNDSFINYLSNHAQHERNPSTMLSSEIVTPISSKSTSTVPKKRGRPKREKVSQTSTEQVSTGEQIRNRKILSNHKSTMKRRKHKKSHIKDMRAKKELRRITHQNRLAILKYMMRKRKQQKQERISPQDCSVTKTELVTSNLHPCHTEKHDQTESNLPEIIAPCLKISIDATQNIESISLYYHRRCKPEIIKENSSITSFNTDNKLGLLLEAVEFIETLQENSKLATFSVK